jgi:hypothetical protein
MPVLFVAGIVTGVISLCRIHRTPGLPGKGFSIIGIVSSVVIPAALVAMAIPTFLAIHTPGTTTAFSATVPSATSSPATAPQVTTTTMAPEPAPALNADGVSLSGGSGWLWDGPPLLLTAAQGAVITTEPQYSTWNARRAINASVRAPAPQGSASEVDMSFMFSAPSGKQLHVGLYQDATGAPFSDVGPGIDVTVGADGCNQELGQFDVKSLTWGVAGPTSFDITFSDACDGSGPLTGELRYGR